MFDPEVNQAVSDLTKALAERYPEVAEIVEKLQLGITSETEAMRQLMVFVRDNGAVGKEIEELATKVFAPLRYGGTQLEAPYTNDIGLQNEEGIPILFTQDLITSLNPLYEGAIHERVQFDGDAPELRHGPMPEGATPAVPVMTTARNPVVIGKQLEEASFDVLKELEQNTLRLIQESEDRQAIEMLNRPSDMPTDMVRSEPQLPMRPTGVPGYEAGKLPALRDVSPPTGSALAQMTPREQQVAAYKALSTTQGRRSALAVIEELVLVGLTSEGHPMPSRPPSRVTEVPVYAEWTVRMSGHEAAQSQFSFLDVAAKALIRKLLPQLAEANVTNPVLEVTTVNTVDVRQVGWAARIVPQES